MPNISITGEVSGLKIPNSISKEYKAHYPLTWPHRAVDWRMDRWIKRRGLSTLANTLCVMFARLLLDSVQNGGRISVCANDLFDFNCNVSQNPSVIDPP